jgi:hypothetical protein
VGSPKVVVDRAPAGAGVDLVVDRERRSCTGRRA